MSLEFRRNQKTDIELDDMKVAYITYKSTSTAFAATLQVYFLFLLKTAWKGGRG